MTPGPGDCPRPQPRDGFMATRVNTKFVVILATVLVVLVGGGVFALKRFTKGAEEYAAQAERMFEEGKAELAKGNIDAGNSLLERAGKNFYQAKQEDSANTGYLVRFIDVHETVVCTDLTIAYNELEAVLFGAENIHDTPNATAEDRAKLYELLHERHRMGLIVRERPAMAYIYNYAKKWLQNHPGDKQASRYLALAEASEVERATNDEAQRKILDNLAKSIEAHPQDPWLRNAAARYHLGNARRLYGIAGSKFTDEVNATFFRAYEELTRAVTLAKDDPAPIVESLGLMLNLRSQEPSHAPLMIGERIETARKLYELLLTKANRDKLFTQELASATQMIHDLDKGIEEHPFTGREFALTLAKAIAQDRPADATAHAILGAIHRQHNDLDAAAKAIEQGLKVVDDNKLPNGQTFVINTVARLTMLSNLSEVKVILAEQAKANGETDLQKQLLVDAASLVEQLAKAPSPNQGWRDARSQFLRGRIDFCYDRSEEAIDRFENANKFYKDRDREVLLFMAETHRRLGNNGLVIETYERVVELDPISPLRLNLIHTYLSQNDAKLLDKAKFHLNNFLSQFPTNLDAIRLKAQVLAREEKPAEAIALLEQQDLEKYPELKVDMSQIKASMGDIAGAVEMVRERVYNTRSEGGDFDLLLVSQLMSYFPDTKTKLEEIDKLQAAGMKASVADVLRKFFKSGRLTMEDELELLAAQQHSPGARALRKYLIYNRWNQAELADQELKQAIRLEPMLPEIIEVRFLTAVQDQRWDDAEIAIKDMLALDIDRRPETAKIADGAFLRARVTTAKAMAMDRGPNRDKMLRDAVNEYTKALKQYSHYVDGWIQLADVQLEQGSYYAAQASLREALKRQSTNTSAMARMAQAEIATGDEPRAMERYENILRLQPNHPSALNDFTELAKKLKVPGRAIIQRERIRDAIPSNTDNRRQLALLYAEDLSYDKAKEEIDGIIKVEGRSLINMMVLAEVLVRGEKTDRAIQEVSDYLKTRGEKADWRDHLLMAQTFEMAKQSEKAEESFKLAIQMEDPKLRSATLAWAQSLLSRGQALQAAAIMEQVSKEMPDNDMLKLRTARVYMIAQQFEKAEQIVKTANDTAERALLLVEIPSLQQGQLGVAIERARAGVKSYPSDLFLRLSLGKLLMAAQSRRPKESQDFKEVLQIAQQLMADHPDRVEAQLLLADTYLALGNKSEALTLLVKILDFAPTNIEANLRLFALKMEEAEIIAQTSVQTSQKKAREAMDIIAVLIDIQPNTPANYRSAGQAADLAGSYSDSAEFYRKAFALTSEAQDLAAYAQALLLSNRGADARTILEDEKHATMVADNLALRALRGRALAASGEPELAANLFSATLKSAQDPGARLMLVKQLSLAFDESPDRAVQIVESVLGDKLPVEIDVELATLMIKKFRYADAASRLAKYEIDPLTNQAAQFQVLSQLGVARQESNQFEAAKKTYESARAIIFNNKDLIPMRQRVHLLNNLAYLLADRMTGYEIEAVKYAREALAQLPKNEAEENVALIEDTLGWALFKAGQYEEAIRVLSSSVKKYELAANHLHLGLAYDAAGKKNEAVLMLAKAIDRAKDEKNPRMIEETEKWYQAISSK